MCLQSPKNISGYTEVFLYAIFEFMSNSYSEKFNLSEAPSLKEKLQNENYLFCTADHALWRAKGKNVVVTLYKSGKLLAQGAGTQDFVNTYIQKGQLSLIAVPQKSDELKLEIKQVLEKQQDIIEDQEKDIQQLQCQLKEIQTKVKTTLPNQEISIQ